MTLGASSSDGVVFALRRAARAREKPQCRQRARATPKHARMVSAVINAQWQTQGRPPLPAMFDGVPASSARHALLMQ